MTGASRTQIDQSNINLFLQNNPYKKRGSSLTIFAVLTARTIHLLWVEVANNNDKVHRSAVIFYPQDSSWNVTFHRVNRAPVHVAPVRFSLGEAHLSGLAGGHLVHVGCPCLAKVEDTRPLVAGLVDHRGLLSLIRIFVFLLLILLICSDGYHLILAICWNLMLGYEKLWYLYSKCLLILPGHLWFCSFFIFFWFFWLVL